MKTTTLFVALFVVSVTLFANKVDSLKLILSNNNINIEQKADINQLIGNIYHEQSKDSIAELFYNRAITQISKVALNTDTSTNRIICNVYLNYCVFNYDISNYDTLLEYIKKFKSLNIKSNTYRRFRIYRLLPFYYSTIAKFEKSLAEYHKLLKFIKPIKKEDSTLYYKAYARTLNDIGTVHLNNQNPEKAKEYILDALRINKNNNLDEKNISVYINLGYAAYRQDSVKLAVKYFEKALAKAIKYKHKEFQSRIIMNLGSVNYGLGNYKKALFYYKKSTELSKKLNLLNGVARGYNSQGYAYMKLEEYKKAIEVNLIAKKIADEYNFMSTKVLSSQVLSRCYEEIGDYKNAFKYFKIQATLEDSVFNKENSKIINEIETKYKVEKKDNKIKLLEKEQEIQQINLKNQQEKSKLEKLLIILISGLTILIIVIILIRFRQKQRNKINKLEKRGLKVETQMLRSQMNPHFIFNSLNSIQSFISDNDTIDAERYLSKFAKLMRLILDNSRKSFITVENEINTLMLYLELEKLRFDNRFDYEININDIDDEFTLIPPMLTQPYIENAILHGVNSISNGKISISFKQINNKIICTVDDNGIGRKKSAEIKSKSQINKTSLGIKVTQERIELLKEENNIDLKIEIIDKYNSEGNAIGTKVIVEMPFTE